MFGFRETLTGASGEVGLAFTDARVDLQGLRPDFPGALAGLEADLGVPFARLTQVHGSEVVSFDAPMAPGAVPQGDALVTATPRLGLMIRVADCVPVLLADPGAGVVAAVHAGRAGVALDVVAATVERMRSAGADDVHAVVGPHVCGGCYEVPDALRAEVAEQVPATYAETTWGTPSLDLGAGVRSQLEAAGVRADRVREVAGCTREDPTWHSHRRDGSAAGRFAGLVWRA